MSTSAPVPGASGQFGLSVVRTRIPSRLDRLPWSRFHWRVVIGLGTVWILDGLEVLLVGAIGAQLTQPSAGVGLTTAEVGDAASCYVAGAVVGALFFGYLTDRFGRRRLFMLTLGMYVLCTFATAFSFSPWYFFLFRILTGFAIGGEYSAINSAIDELIPARVRGSIDLVINGSFWFGGILAAALSWVLLTYVSSFWGWRLAYGLGVVLGLFVLLVRRNLPESPRWLFIHGRAEEAEAIVDRIEQEVESETGQRLEEVEKTITVRQRRTISFWEIARTAFRLYPTRSLLALSLFIGQAFIYNAFSFDLGTLLGTFFGVAASTVPLFAGVFALSNLAGPLSIGRLFDTVGRKPMITLTYLGSAAISVVLAVFFVNGTLNAWTFMAVVMAVFFLASAGASSAYLTASEIFPMETRAMAIAFFYAVGTGIGGITGPTIFSHLIASGSATQVTVGFLIGAGVMALGGVAAMLWGVKAERRQLEDIARPLTATEDEAGGAAGSSGPALAAGGS